MVPEEEGREEQPDRPDQPGWLTLQGIYPLLVPGLFGSVATLLPRSLV
jgi:hypothetical protein